MLPLPPISTSTATLCPYTTLCRSDIEHHIIIVHRLELCVIGAHAEIDRAIERGLQAEFLTELRALRLGDVESRHGVGAANLRIAVIATGQEVDDTDWLIFTGCVWTTRL